MATRALAVAAVASVLLVVLISADAAMNRSYALEIQQEGGWRSYAKDPVFYDEARPYGLEGPYPTIPMNRSDNLTLRIKVDNGFAWGLAKEYRVYVNGIEFTTGTITAPARGIGYAEFTIPGAKLLAAGGAPVPVKEPAAPTTVTPSIYVIVDDANLWAYPTIQEVAK